VSDQPKDTGSPDDLLSKQPRTRNRLDPQRLAPWQQEQSRTPPPPQPERREDGKTGGSPKRALLQRTKGHDQKSRVSLRKLLDVELPQPPPVQEAIKLTLIDSDVSPPPRPSQPPPKRMTLGLHRTERKRDLGDMALTAWTSMRDDVMSKWASFADSFDQAKTQKRSVLGKDGVDRLRDDLVGKLKAAVAAADKFLQVGPPVKDLGRGRTEDKRRPELARLQKEVEPVAAAAKAQLKAIEDLFDDPGQGPDEIGQGFEVKQRGIRFSDLKLGQYGDDKLDRDKSKEDFAGGAVNKVSKLIYGDEVRIFKSEALTTNSRANQIGIAGIDKSAPRFGNRNIATKAMSDALGGSVIPDSCYTIHDGKIGLLMEGAPGEEMKDFKKKGFDPKPPSEDLVAALHAQLNELEWTDMLTGQGDRHDGNYMIDAKPGAVKITGIDNDFCFGKNQDDYNNYGSKPEDGEGRGGRRGPYWGYNSAEMPPLIDKNAYDKLIATKFDDDVKPKLAGLLTEQEITASASRFKQMQDHARSLHPAYVVASWKDWRSPQDAEPPGATATEFLKGSKKISLFQRDFSTLV
jgi:hypothetical protein